MGKESLKRLIMVVRSGVAFLVSFTGASVLVDVLIILPDAFTPPVYTPCSTKALTALDKPLTSYKTRSSADSVFPNGSSLTSSVTKRSNKILCVCVSTPKPFTASTASESPSSTCSIHAYKPSESAGGSKLINFSTTNSASEASIWRVAYNAATKSYAS
jgi:hypothetical protein